MRLSLHIGTSAHVQDYQALRIGKSISSTSRFVRREEIVAARA
ncbi:hypothetical protein F4827_005740 [Paraburkholderia bannensis]|uniref:Uncharacterized protein n=1 Tax=Paraburkholderia bannensis TaxID=765414 RepID=A0A7W9WU07_9BURK|nr:MULTISPECIES: hypothetical protein [Paraburkholderia]MBB3260700.1 hypothetical protein [Paraburkholderia sp. WP4_3_2]MBB6105870.1 hypothetical protein [Paraburkholderia bannensis]